MKFCSHCAGPLIQRIPAGDNRLRHVCSKCEAVHYQNPRIVAGCLPVWGDQVLLCRRAIEPRRGYWTLPAGFMENGETLEQAAARETHEEACARVRDLAAVHPVRPAAYQPGVPVLSRRTGRPGLRPGEESLEVQLFHEPDIPWSELAFPTVGRTLECYFADRRRHVYPVRNEPLEPLRTPHQQVH
jgi:ADP-ribose pyrophosphatase YjhB (NUDIX family)